MTKQKIKDKKKEKETKLTKKITKSKKEVKSKKPKKIKSKNEENNDSENSVDQSGISAKQIKSNKEYDFSKIKLCKPPKVQSYKHGIASEPNFSSDYTILKNCVLQATELNANHNKYYALELHESLNPKSYRLFTHYGRTDDLETNPNAGQKETRYYDTVEEAWSAYNQILKQKTGDRKGYQPVNLIATNIGSEKAVKQQIKAGEIGKSTQEILKKKEKIASNLETKVKHSKLQIEIQNLIEELFSETISSLTSMTNVKITENGLQTPLGVLTMEQLNQADSCLEEILNELNTSKKQQVFQSLSNKFYMLVPQKLGRSSISQQCINNQQMLIEKRELVQFMKDCLEKAQSKQGNVLFSASIDQRYESLGCEIKVVKKQSNEEKSLIKYIKQTLGYVEEGCKAEDEYQMPQIKQIFEINRKIDRFEFKKHKIGNEKLMYHGTKVQNLVGILTRGILLPKAVTALGISRTVFRFFYSLIFKDFGWLGAGIYFGDVLNTAEQYSQPGQQKNIYILLANVALGKIQDQAVVNEGLRPPKGIDTMHGNPDLKNSEFDDHEFCIYRQDQFYLQYLLQLQY